MTKKRRNVSDSNVLRTCIYCKKTKGSDQFNDEHVLPQAFGKYHPGLTLHCVCKECNGHFGNTIDRCLGRDTYDGFMRFKYGIKKLTELNDLQNERLTFELPADGSAMGKEWGGVQVETFPQDNQIYIRLLPQIRLKRISDQSWTSIGMRELEAGKFAQNPDFDLSTVKIFSNGPSEDDERKIVQILKEHGVNLPELRPIAKPSEEKGEITIILSSLIDKTIRRALAKMAFNYFAVNVVDTLGNAVLLAQEFDPIRNFILHNGPEPLPSFVNPSSHILGTDTATRRKTESHLMAMDWQKGVGGKRQLIVKISFFNDHTYEVRLCDDYKGMFFDVAFGHEFDHKTNPRAVKTLVRQSTSLFLNV